MKRNNEIDKHKEEIIKLYNEGKIYKELAEMFNVSPSIISTRMRKWKANNSDSNRFKRKDISKDILYDMYWNKEMHPRAIGKVLGCSFSTIHNFMKKYGIKTRTKSESRIGKLNPIYGVGHTKDARKKMSESYLNGRKLPSKTPFGKRVKYTTPNQNSVTMRSTYYLTRHGIDWYYEPEVFKVTDLHSYRPDFYLPVPDVYIEVKGVMSDIDLIKIEAFRELGYSLEVWDREVLLEKDIINKYGKTSYIK